MSLCLGIKNVQLFYIYVYIFIYVYIYIYFYVYTIYIITNAFFEKSGKTEKMKSFNKSLYPICCSTLKLI